MFRARTLIAGLLCAGALSATALSVAALPASAAGTSPCPSTAVLQITHMAFNPAVVFPGQSSTVHVAALNCTGQSVHASLTWLARFVGPTPGIPSGCPAIDPLSVPANFAPHGRFAGKLTYLVPAGCTATSLVSTAEFAVGGAVVAEKSASLTITRPPA
jgi:hypothetical protein